LIFNPIRLELPVLAVAKARAKRGAHGQAYIPKKTKSFEAELRWHWQSSKNQMIPLTPTLLKVCCLLPRPKSVKKTTLFPVTRPDLDNYAKAIMDGLNGFAWKDDAQISELHISKRYTEFEPKLVIEIWPVEAS
jgi:Holliday junction resolvase RusA-like endonuclease